MQKSLEIIKQKETDRNFCSAKYFRFIIELY